MVKMVVERSGSLVRVTACAPDGYVWKAGVHELVAEARGGAEATAECRRDVAERMRLGLERCLDVDCEWCHGG